MDDSDDDYLYNDYGNEDDKTDDDYYGEVDDDVEDSENRGDHSYYLTLRWILTVFIRIQQKFNISNRATTAILAFISMLLNIISHPLSLLFPKTLNGAIRTAEPDFNNKMKKILYVVCPKERCNALFEVGQKNCSHTSFGRVCGSALGYERHLAFGKKKWTPFKNFQFIPPTTWLKKMFTCKEFVSHLEHSSGSTHSSILKDIKDGRVWKDFSTQGFFVNNHNLGLMMNVDWFKPFKRSEYKVAAIMISVLNLPREERFKKKWTMIAGMLYII